MRWLDSMRVPHIPWRVKLQASDQWTTKSCRGKLSTRWIGGQAIVRICFAEMCGNPAVSFYDDGDGGDDDDDDDDHYHYHCNCHYYYVFFIHRTYYVLQCCWLKLQCWLVKTFMCARDIPYVVFCFFNIVTLQADTIVVCPNKQRVARNTRENTKRCYNKLPVWL